MSKLEKIVTIQSLIFTFHVKT